MSNFLDNLASRSLKLVPVVQPRLASRFEPPTLAGSFPSAAPVEDAEAERTVEGEALNARPDARRPETRVVETRRTVPIPSQDAPREERAGREEQASPRQSPPPRPASAAHVPVRPVETRAQSLQSDTTAAEPHAGPPPPSSFDEEPQTNETVRSDALRSVDEAALDSRIRRLMAGRLNIVEGEAATRGTPVAQQPQARREREAQESSPEKTQTIRVTIGRIDVRAVTSPAPQEPRRAPARPAPQLSLADYLKQRGGGRR